MLNFTVNSVHHSDAVRTVIYRQLPPKSGGKGGGVDIKHRMVQYIQENLRSYLHFSAMGSDPIATKMEMIKNKQFLLSA